MGIRPVTRRCERWRIVWCGHFCVARYGGEEFAVICRGSTLDDGRRLAGRLLRAVRELTIRHEELTICVSVSIGLAEARFGEDAVQWMYRADQALYAAKQLGRNRVESGA